MMLQRAARVEAMFDTPSVREQRYARTMCRVARSEERTTDQVKYR